MNSAEIRRKFLEFFEEKGHLIVPSAPLVLKSDPTLMFTNSGMVQFKDYFLGNAKPPSPRIADTQKCLRVSGKHNDLEEVGIDTYHHTMFEMLGNWSFGDYFKKEAIAWAWELLTEVYGLPKDRLYVTVFGGDQEDGLPVDTEARDLWSTIVNEDRILLGSRKDNFWEMGDTGPCGPCSEIHIDLRPDDEVKKTPGRELVNRDHPQVIEIWNLVFMEFNRKADGSLERLPARHVDTGMGFERLCRAIQKKASTYDTDVFEPINVTYGQDPRTDIAMRVVADHIRAVAFAVADGQLPSNTGAGYVIRRILRRAVRYGFTFLNFKEPFLHKLVHLVAGLFKDVFPELEKQKVYVSKVILEEEVSFLRTLEKGLKRLDHLHQELGEGVISGEQAFELYDTYGFPFDLTALIARERGMRVDEEGFRAAMERQKSRSRADAVRETGDWTEVMPAELTEFVGYEHLEADVRITRYRKSVYKNKETYQLVFDRTPFYAESGGQVGDTGYLVAGDERIRITDTRKENELIVHFASELPRNPEGIYKAVVDRDKRLRTRNNHTATHLLHAALREVLGKHVEQRGSLVNEKLLRFDFSHFTPMTPEEIAKVEELVNARIRDNIRLDERRNVPLQEAKKMGAMALFGEKYGDYVRVIIFDPAFSVELCGGTHVGSTGEIGLFKIVSEGSVAAGVRRIEAVTSAEALRFVQNQLDLLHEVRNIFKNPKDLVAAASNLVAEKQRLEKKLEELYLQQAMQLKDRLAEKARKVNGYHVIMERVAVPNADALKQIAYALRNQFDDLFLVLAAEIDSKPQVAVMIGEKLMASNRFHAGNLVRELAKEIGGGGGGQPFFATAGGRNLAGLDTVLEKARKLIEN